MIFNEGIGKASGQPDLPVLSNPGTASDLLQGKELIDQQGAIVTGTMPNNGAVSQALNAGGSYTIPAGYHNGSGKVTANSLAGQTPGTATAEDIANGKIAWVNGAKLTGNAQIGYSLVRITVNNQSHAKLHFTHMMFNDRTEEWLMRSVVVDVGETVDKDDVRSDSIVIISTDENYEIVPTSTDLESDTVIRHAAYTFIIPASGLTSAVIDVDDYN